MSIDLLCLQHTNTVKGRLLNATIGRFTKKDYRPDNVVSLLNMSNSNWARFSRFVRDVLVDTVTECQEIVDSQVLDDTGEPDYDAWRAQVMQEEKDELAEIKSLLGTWTNDNCSLEQALSVMTIVMYHPNAAQYKGYINRILDQGVKALAKGNASTYWA